MAPDLDTGGLRVVNQKETYRAVLRQSADGDVLAVAGKIRKAECRRPKGFEKSLWSAAMLNVRLAVGRSRRDENAVHAGEESNQSLVDSGLKATHALTTLLERTRAKPFLRGARRWRKYP